MRQPLTTERVFQMQQVARDWDFGAHQSSSFREPARAAWNDLLQSMSAYDFEELCEAWLTKNPST